MSRRPLLALALAVLALGGCNRAYRNAMARAEQAQAAGDALGAALAMREACQAAPDDAEVCGRAEQLAREEADRSLASAQQPCQLGEVDGCGGALRSARALFPADPRIQARLADCERAYVLRCGSAEAEVPEEALARLRCLEAAAPLLTSEGFAGTVRGARVKLAALLQQTADGGEHRALTGARYAALASAACLTRDAQVLARRDEAKAAFLQEALVPLRVGLQLAGAVPAPLGGICAQAQGALPPAVRCEAASRQPPLAVSLRLEPEAPRHDVTEEVRSLRYVAGTTTVPNPDYALAARRRDRAQSSYQAAQNDMNLARSDCDYANADLSRARYCFNCYERNRADQACNRFDALRRANDDRYGELQSADNHLRMTQPYLQQSVYETFRYLERHHHFEMRYGLHLDIQGMLGSAGLDEPGTVSFDDDEHVAFPQGRLAGDPLEEPGTDEYWRELSRRLQQRLAQIASAEMQARAQSRADGCGQPQRILQASYLDCWTQAALWRGVDLDGPALLEALAAAADAAQGGTKLPVPGCRR